MQEFLKQNIQKVAAQGLQTRPHELQAILEEDVLAEGHGKVLFHPLSNHTNLLHTKPFLGLADEGGIAAPNFFGRTP